MKYEKIRNVIINFLSIVLVFYIGFTLLFFAILNITKNYVNQEKIENVIDNFDLSNVIKNNVEIDNIKDILIDSGLTNDMVDEFFESQAFKEFETQVLSNIIYDVLRKGNIDYQFDVTQINNLIFDNIDELKDSEEYHLITKKIDERMPSLVENANVILEKISEKLQNSPTFMKYKGYINKLFKIFDIVYSNVVNYLILFVIISFILMLMFMRKNILSSLKFIGIAFVSASILIVIFTKLLLRIFAFTQFNDLINIVIYDFKKYCMTYITIGIIFIVINLVIYIVKRRKKLTHES